jgi:hypothetical protein
MQRTLYVWVSFVSLILGGCLGSGGGSSGTVSERQEVINQAPTISGTPLVSIMPGEKYAFQPAAADLDGDKLGFTIARLPAWATFDNATGRLSGTPQAGDIGQHSGITITVSDGKSSTSLPAFDISVRQSADGSVTLSWMPPTENVDGSVLRNLAGYRIHFGQSADAMTRVIILDNPGLTRHVVENLSPATWYFAMTSVNAKGAESSRSAVVSKQIA